MLFVDGIPLVNGRIGWQAKASRADNGIGEFLASGDECLDHVVGVDLIVVGDYDSFLVFRDPLKCRDQLDQGPRSRPQRTTSTDR